MTEYGHGGDIYSQEVELDYSANINPLGMPEGESRSWSRPSPAAGRWIRRLPIPTAPAAA